MQTLIFLFVSFVDRIRQTVGMVIPMFREASDFRSWPTWARVLVTLIVFAVIIAGLYWLNGLPFVDRLLQKYANGFVRQHYLPIVFMLLLALSWIGYLWWQLFNAEETAEYPDIQQAWEEVVQGLRKAGVGVGDLPLYFVVGRPQGGDDSLFLAARQKVESRLPAKAVSPIRVFASESAIFVTCSGASTWGRYIERLHDAESMSATPDQPTATTAGATITPGQALQGVDEKLQDEFYELLREQSNRALTPEEQYRLHELGELLQKAKSNALKRVTMASDELANGPRRLAYLCRLIVRDRQPWCPVNGVLVLVPWATLESDELARTAVGVLSTDLSTVRGTFRQRYPSYVMVSDLDQAYGFDEFRRGFRTNELSARVGQRIPLVPDRPASEMPAVLEYVADWIRLNVMPSFVINWLRLEWPPESRKTVQFVPSYNQKLFFFLHDLFQRGPRLGRILANGLPVEPRASGDEPAAALPLVGGCYLAATGRDERNQAFVAGVFQRLTDGASRNAVAWSERALEQERAYSRRTVMLYAASLVLAVVMAGGVYYYKLRPDTTFGGGKTQAVTRG